MLEHHWTSQLRSIMLSGAGSGGGLHRHERAISSEIPRMIRAAREMKGAELIPRGRWRASWPINWTWDPKTGSH